MEKNISKIIDVSWRFGVTAASNDSDNVAKSFLQLKLSLDNGGKINNVFIEMTIGQFYKFLHDLEKAKCNLDLLL
ncbi:COMM domain-containing protein 7 [Harpegnathos saltator]|uniref:COMM domain-containing protein 7 n=1 Tax=Harpegnathos saltator TaxID=610380 RepID=E2C1A1_HARSA|nr:COMM domain-containing protein 7 [Harpegnathos saltator]XP_011148862.1 COMM domain-containing protein 7 [Harpegnathos saltator]XP_011148863.1 COMM domain-containing protein 7 [Harpegnathos saltator]EFN78263.1 COMM domain-containing protein 7 [Harpegnathos saltator]